MNYRSGFQFRSASASAGRSADYAVFCCCRSSRMRRFMSRRFILIRRRRLFLFLTPSYYAPYLAKAIGPYATLGLAEDTWARNEGIFSDEIFLRQAYLTHQEREAMFFHVLERTTRGLCACVFDASDRIQHMFWRTGQGKEIRDVYIKLDELLARVQRQLKKEDVLMVLSKATMVSPLFAAVSTLIPGCGKTAPPLKPGEAAAGEQLQGVDWPRQGHLLSAFAASISIAGDERRKVLSRNARPPD